MLMRSHLLLSCTMCRVQLVIIHCRPDTFQHDPDKVWKGRVVYPNPGIPNLRYDQFALIPKRTVDVNILLDRHIVIAG